MTGQAFSMGPPPEGGDKSSPSPNGELPAPAPDLLSVVLEEDLKGNLLTSLLITASLSSELGSTFPRALGEWQIDGPEGEDLRLFFLRIHDEAGKAKFGIRYAQMLADNFEVVTHAVELALAKELQKSYSRLVLKTPGHALRSEFCDSFNEARLAAHYAVASSVIVYPLAHETPEGIDSLQLDPAIAFHLRSMLEMSKPYLPREWDDTSDDEPDCEFRLPELEAWNAEQRQPAASILEEALEALEHDTLPGPMLQLLRENSDDIETALLHCCFEAMPVVDDPPTLFMDGQGNPEVASDIMSTILRTNELIDLYNFLVDEAEDRLDELLDPEEEDGEEEENPGQDEEVERDDEAAPVEWDRDLDDELDDY